jgi:hypothetical protein
LAGEISEWKREEFDFFKKSAEGGCSWGQAEYGWYFRDGYYVVKDQNVYVEWLEEAVNQNNPKAMWWLGEWFRREGGDDKKKAFSYFRAAAELGWKPSMVSLVGMLYCGQGCEKDLRQAVIWSAKGNSSTFWNMLGDARRSLERGTAEKLDCDFNELCYTLGWGLYWYQYGSERWKQKSDGIKDFGERCLGHYCSSVELQQKSIFTFLLCWNRTTGVKPPGQLIAQLVWEEREDNLVKAFEEPQRRSARLKRIKK